MSKELKCPVKRIKEKDPTSISVTLSKPDKDSIKIDTDIVLKDKITPLIEKYYKKFKDFLATGKEE